jgi:hypothetical protein
VAENADRLATAPSQGRGGEATPGIGGGGGRSEVAG